MKIHPLENYALNALAKLRAEGHELVDNLADAEILLVRSRTSVDSTLLERALKLKLVVTATSGFDHIDWRACQTRGVTAAYCPSANAQSTAELTMTLLLALERRLLTARGNVQAHRWREGLARPHGLEGQSLGIIGLGRVGQKVARLAGAFGMEIHAFDPYIEPEIFSEAKAERMSLIEVLKSSDYVSLHVPLTKETHHLLNGPTFNEMQTESMLINTCRGAVVDENELLLALDDGVIAGAACDVIEREPPKRGHRVLNHPKLLLTPHIGAFTDQAWEKASSEAADKAMAFARGEKVLDTLPLTAPWFEKT